jgi:tetratricopeptide (TPR) repeat protein
MRITPQTRRWPNFPTIGTVAHRRVEAARRGRDAFAGDEILRLAMSLPAEAIGRGRAIMAARPDDEQASYALQAMSIAHRELGDGAAALRCARQAVRAAERSGLTDRAADARATLGSTLAVAGRIREALAELDGALSTATGVHAARIRMRRGGVLRMMGRHGEAMNDLRAAIPSLRSAHDTVYEARALTARAMVYDDLGEWTRSDRDLRRSEELMRETGQQLESVWARHNRGHVAFRAGNLPTALGHYDAAETMYEAVGARDAELELDRCRVLLAAGMPDDARRHATNAVQLLEGNTARADARAEAMLTAASAGLAAGDARTARDFAEAAARSFRVQQRAPWVLRAQRVVILARWLSGEGSRSLLQQASAVADQLSTFHDSAEAVEAHLLAGRIALSVRDDDAARSHLDVAALARRRGPSISRATGWLAQALQAEASGDARRLLSASRRGLDLLDQHQLTLGATEMRARGTVHGAELASIATRHAIRTRSPQRLLQCSERWRATALTAAPVRPPDDAGLALELSALRDVTRRIGEARGEGQPTTSLEHEQSRIEASVRRRMLRTSGTAAGARERFDLRRLREELGDTTLIELVEVDDVLHVVTVGRRHVVMHTVGPTATALSELEFALFGLRRIAAAASPALIRASAVSLQAAAGSLEKALLGPAVDRLGDGAVLVVPSGRLHAVPWSLLPSLRDREVSVAPSATSWLRARHVSPPAGDRVTLVVGPGLETGGAEVAKVAGFYADARLLDGPGATADDVLEALNGASLAHIAAHGTFRADNALFSCLRMTDGPLTVHDLERLRRPPHRLVLSSCDSGLGTVAGADELLGLSSALIGMGSAGLLASVLQVNDAATVALMVAVHEQLRDGATLAAALHRARMALGTDDPVLAATGQSFIALGAA